MPHVISRTPRTAQNGHLSGQPANKNISSSIIRVTLKTPGKQEDFMIAADTSVRQFKEKLSAHFKCKIDQLVLVFMGCLLKDHDTLSQRGILDGHTIHLVIKSKQGSRSLIHSSQNMPTNKLCHRDRNTKGNSSEVFQPAVVMNHNSVESALFVEPDTPQGLTQNLEVGRPECIAQMLENSSTQLLLSTTDLMRQFISEHPEMQQLMQQNSEVSHITDNSEILRQTLELARNLVLIQEIMQIHQPTQTLECPLNPPSQLGLETIPGGNNALGQSYADSKDQILNSSQDPFKGNPSTAPIEAQVREQVQSSPSYSSSSQERLDQLPVTQVIYTSSCDLSSITSSNATSNKVNHTSRGNTATNSTKGQNHTCDIQQPGGVQALPSREFTQQLQAEDDLQLSEEQTNSSQIIGSMMKLLLSNFYLAVQMMMFMSMSQLNEQWRQQLLSFLQQMQPSDILIALANPKASQAMLQIEHGVQLLTTEAPVLLPWIAPYLWGLGCLPAPSCSYPDTVPRAWDVPNMAEPEGPECCHKYGASL